MHVIVGKIKDRHFSQAYLISVNLTGTCRYGVMANARSLHCFVRKSASDRRQNGTLIDIFDIGFLFRGNPTTKEPVGFDIMGKGLTVPT